MYFFRISWILLIALAIPGHSCRAAGVSVPTAAMVIVKGVAGLVALAPIIDFFEAIKKDKEAKIKQLFQKATAQAQNVATSSPMDPVYASSIESPSVLPIMGGIAVLFVIHHYVTSAFKTAISAQTDKQEMEVEKG